LKIRLVEMLKPERRALAYYAYGYPLPLHA